MITLGRMAVLGVEASASTSLHKRELISVKSDLAGAGAGVFTGRIRPGRFGLAGSLCFGVYLCFRPQASAYSRVVLVVVLHHALDVEQFVPQPATMFLL